MWSLIILFILYHSVGSLYLTGVATPPEIKRCLGGPRGAAATLWSPHLGGVSGVASLKLKIDVKLPYKIIVISSQSGPFIRRMI